MKSIAVPLMVLLGAVLLLAAAAPQQAVPEQEKTLAEPAGDLQCQLDAERRVRADLEARLERLEKEMASVLEWTAGLDKASRFLSTAAEKAREHGFEYAAPNPQARTDVLEGLRGFARALLEKRPRARTAKKTTPSVASQALETATDK